MEKKTEKKTRKAKEFLLEILADGGMAQKKIEEEAEKLGIKKKTLRNAKMELGIDSIKRWKSVVLDIIRELEKGRWQDDHIFNNRVSCHLGKEIR